MKRIDLAALTVLLLLAQSPAFAATKTFPVQERHVVVDENGTHVEPRTRPVGFEFRIVSDDRGELPESRRDGRPFAAAEPGERFTIRLRNPLPVRVAVNVSVDGLNSISGKPSGIADGEKWMLEPYGTLELRGWQVSGDEARRFFFTDKPKSYAKWREDQVGKELSANCGVIGAAFFWSQAELDQYYAERPEYRYTMRYLQPAFAEDRASAGAARSAAPAPGAAMKQEAGTGMGERESHPTTEVSFSYDTGMYRVSQAVVLYYDFAPKPPVPNPFPELSYAPEMPVVR